MKKFTKTLSLIFIALAFYPGLFAQAPQGISYQAIARTDAGNIIKNQSISLRFSILDATANGKVVYSETQSATTNNLGLFSLFIGKGKPVTGTFADIDWASAAKYFQVEMDASGGTSYVDMGTQQMMSVPYAVYADKAGNGLPAGTIGQTLYYDGSKWVPTRNMTLIGGSVNMRGSLTLSDDAANADDRYSLQIETQKPIMLPRMSQFEMNFISRAEGEGMTVFNTDAHKVQVFAMLTNNFDILNEMHAGTSTDRYFGPLTQNFISPVSGHIVAIEVLLKNRPESGPYEIDFIMGRFFQRIFIPTTLFDFTWHKIILDTPLEIFPGIPTSFSFDGPGLWLGDYLFATNSFYPYGSGDSDGTPFPAAADDLVFRIHIEPTPGSYGWQNLN